MICSAALLLLGWAQDPAPPVTPEPLPTPPEAQDPEASPVSVEDVMKAMGQVSERMAEVSSSLRDVSGQVDTTGVLPAASALDGAVNSSRLLLEEMESLLALIPEPPPPPPSSGGDGNSQGNRPDSGAGQDPSSRPQGNLPSPGDAESDQQESPDGNSERPPESPMSSLLQVPTEGQWGNLPPRLQRTIDAASTNDVPLRYRRWLIEYHRRAGE